MPSLGSLKLNRSAGVYKVMCFFFTIIVWNMVANSSFLAWNSSRVSPHTPKLTYGSNPQVVTVTSWKMVTILVATLDRFYRKFSFIELAGIETKPYVFFLEIKTIIIPYLCCFGYCLYLFLGQKRP